MTAPSPLSSPALQAALRAWKQAGRGLWLPVEGESMAPLLQPGDQVRVDEGCPAPEGETGLPPGVLLAVWAGGQVVVHRLWRRLPDGRLQTAGDRAGQLDPPVDAQAVIGPVTQVATPDGRTIDLLSAPARRLARWQLWLARWRGRPILWRLVGRLGQAAAGRLAQRARG